MPCDLHFIPELTGPSWPPPGTRMRQLIFCLLFAWLREWNSAVRSVVVQCCPALQQRKNCWKRKGVEFNFFFQGNHAFFFFGAEFTNAVIPAYFNINTSSSQNTGITTRHSALMNKVYYPKVFSPGLDFLDIVPRSVKLASRKLLITLCICIATPSELPECKIGRQSRQAFPTWVMDSWENRLHNLSISRALRFNCRLHNLN